MHTHNHTHIHVWLHTNAETYKATRL